MGEEEGIANLWYYMNMGRREICSPRKAMNAMLNELNQARETRVCRFRQECVVQDAVRIEQTEPEKTLGHQHQSIFMALVV